MTKHKKRISLNNDFFDKCSLIFLSIWVFFPLIVMLLTKFVNNAFARDALYYTLYVVGFLGIFTAIIYIVIKILNKNFDLKKYFPILIFIALLLWCLITCFTSNQPYRSFVGTVYRKDGFSTYIIYFGILLLGMLLKKRRTILINELLVVEVIMAIVSLMDNDITHMLTANVNPYAGIFSQFNHYAYYLMFGIISAICLFISSDNIIKSILYFSIYTLLLYTLVINDTFGCFLAVLSVMILIFIYFRKKIKKVLLVLLVFLAVCTFTTNDNQNIVLNNFNILHKDTQQIKLAVKTKQINEINKVGTSRGILWKIAIENSFKKPITGYGIENFEQVYLKSGIVQDRPHNVLIQFMVFTGIPGMLLYILFISVVLIKGFCSIKKLKEIDSLPFFVVLCYFISSIFGNSMFYTSPYYFIFLGFLLSNLNLTKEKH